MAGGLISIIMAVVLKLCISLKMSVCGKPGNAFSGFNGASSFRQPTEGKS